jgi:hypothetical protein
LLYLLAAWSALQSLRQCNSRDKSPASQRINWQQCQPTYVHLTARSQKQRQVTQHSEATETQQTSTNNNRHKRQAHILLVSPHLWHSTFSSTCSQLQTSPPAAAIAYAVCCTAPAAALLPPPLPLGLLPPTPRGLLLPAPPPVTCKLYTLLPVGPADAAPAAPPPVSRDAANGPNCCCCCCLRLAPVLPARGEA